MDGWIDTCIDRQIETELYAWMDGQEIREMDI
jgi:hypothetical protein